MWWYRRYYFSIFVITAERLVEVRVLYSLTLLLCDLIDYWLLGLAIRVQFASLLVSLHVVTSSCIITTVDALNLKQLWGFIYTHTHSKIFSMNFIKSEPIPTQNEPIPTFWANTDTKWANTDTRKWANTDTVSQYRHSEMSQYRHLLSIGFSWQISQSSPVHSYHLLLSLACPLGPLGLWSLGLKILGLPSHCKQCLAFRVDFEDMASKFFDAFAFDIFLWVFF